MDDRQATATPVFRRRRILIPAAIGGVAALVAAGYLLTPAGPATTVSADDYRVVNRDDVVSRVMVSGTVAPQRSVTLSTHLSGPVDTLTVKVGDHVNAEQILATIDVSAQQRELDTQRAQQATGDASAVSQLEQAQQQYQQYKDGLDQGLNQQVISAEAALRTADGQYTEAQAAFEAKTRERATGSEAQIREQGTAVENSRTQVVSAALEALRSGVTAVDTLAGSEPGAGQPGPAAENGAGAAGAVIGTADSVNRLHGAAQTLTQSQQSYEATLEKVDQDLAAQQRAVGQAFEARKEAAIALEAARLAANQQLATHASAVDQAYRSAQAAQSVSAQGSSQLQVDIAARDVRTPMSGIVTSVAAEEGKTAAGTLLTVADEGALLVRTEVKEIDVPQITVGDAVTVTTPTTGNREYRGTVRFVSPVASPGPAAGEEQPKDPGSRRATFPVEIEITGPVDGLRIGGTAKARIITDRETGVLAVPRDAVLEDNGVFYALVLAEQDGEHQVQRRQVRLGAANDIDVAVVDGELADGDRVITQPSEFQEFEGQDVAVDDARD